MHFVEVHAHFDPWFRDFTLNTFPISSNMWGFSFHREFNVLGKSIRAMGVLLGFVSILATSGCKRRLSAQNWFPTANDLRVKSRHIDKLEPFQIYWYNFCWSEASTEFSCFTYHLSLNYMKNLFCFYQMVDPYDAMHPLQKMQVGTSLSHKRK